MNNRERYPAFAEFIDEMRKVGFTPRVMRFNADGEKERIVKDYDDSASGGLIRCKDCKWRNRAGRCMLTYPRYNPEPNLLNRCHLGRFEPKAFDK